MQDRDKRGAEVGGRPETRVFGQRLLQARAFRLDAAVGVVIAVGWWCWLVSPVCRDRPLADDSFRDTAYAANIIEGRLLDDPSMPGFSWWYAPGGPLMYAGLSVLTGVRPMTLYSSSILWVNVWIPIGIYIVVRSYWDRGTAVASLLMVWLGSLWWQTHLAMPMPSIQGLVFVLLALALWRTALGGGRGRAVALGVVLAVCAWHHILCAVVVSGAIGLHALLWAATDRGRGRYRPLVSACTAGGVCAVLISPLVWHMVTIPWNNPAHSGTGGQMATVEYALHAGTPLVIPLALFGAFHVARKPACPGAWVLGYLAVGLIGQAPVYLGRLFNVSPPQLLPHEFQWHGQLAVGILAGIGLVRAARWVGRRAAAGVRRHAVTAVTAGFLVLLVVWPDGARALDRYDTYWVSTRYTPDVAATIEWIRAHSEITDVFVCRYLPGYYEVAGPTGRKLILMPEARANPATLVARRRRDLRRLETTNDPAEYVDIAVGRYGARFVYLTRDNGNLLERWSNWGIFETAYRSPNGERTILRIVDRGRESDGSN